MQILQESEALQLLVTSLYEISNQKCEEWMQDDLVMENISWKTINSLLLRANWENVDEDQIRQYLYKLTDDAELYKEILNKMWWPFILWVNDRWNRWWDFDWGRWIHMWVDYNLPKWEPIRSIYDWTVVAKRSWTKITGDKTVIKHINDIYWEDWWKPDNILIIEHKILWKTFYSLYIHISDEENISVGSTVKKWQEIWKIAWYEENSHRQPHLHFTIMKTLDSRPMISWYLNKLTVPDDEKDKDYQKLYDKKYCNDMINPMDIYN
jgi:murein DD-endopeptidase MepM/ murein hydrolase activator NlpD